MGHAELLSFESGKEYEFLSSVTVDSLDTQEKNFGVSCETDGSMERTKRIMALQEARQKRKTAIAISKTILGDLVNDVVVRGKSKGRHDFHSEPSPRPTKKGGMKAKLRDMIFGLDYKPKTVDESKKSDEPFVDDMTSKGNESFNRQMLGQEEEEAKKNTSEEEESKH